jgi:uncharacterized protein
MQTQSGVDAALAESKLALLEEILRPLGPGRLCVAYSGGVDSAFLLAVAVRTLGADQVVAAIGVSPSLPQRERVEAAQLAKQLGCECVEIATTELADADYVVNSAQRCYFCKADLYRHLQELCRQRGLATIVNGANADDTGDYRPGMRAADDFAVQSPILAANMNKAEVRFLSARMGLPTADKPAMACLASRFVYGTPLSVEGLKMVESAEDYLWKLGLRNFRVRHHGTLARIELPADRIAEFAEPSRRAELVAKLKQIGYTYVTLDLQGFRSGSGNEVLTQIGLLKGK